MPALPDRTHAAPRTFKAPNQGRSRRGEILAAAARIFREGGVAPAAARRIAAAVGASTNAAGIQPAAGA